MSYPIFDESTKDGEHFIHDKCGTTLLAAKVTHSLWDRRFTCAGYGEVEIEMVPYCPVCEKKPSESGAPIHV